MEAIDVKGKPEHHDLTRLRVAARVLATLPDLHERAREHWGPPLNVARVLRRETQDRRVRFVGGGGGSSMLGCDEVDAIVHAAEHGYTVCSNPADRGRCWLPEGHRGVCCGDLWRWRLLYGQDQSDLAVMVVCSACTPHEWVARPADCPHRDGE